MGPQRTKNVRHTNSRLLEVEPLEDRRVLSLMGLLPAGQLDPTALIVRAGPMASAVNDSSLAGTTVALSTPSLLSGLLGPGLDLLGSLGTENAAPAGSTSVPHSNTLGVLSSVESMTGLHLSLGADLTAGRGTSIDIGLNMGGGTDTEPASNLGVDLNLGDSVNVSSDVVSSEPGVNSGVTPSIAKTVPAPALGNATSPLASNSTTPISQTGRTTSVVVSSASAATNPVALLNVAPGRGANPAADLPRRAASSGAEAVDVAAPVLPANLGAYGAEAGAERPSLAPETSGLLADASPFDVAAMERSLQQFLGQLDELHENVRAMFGNLGATAWVLASVAVAAAVHELVRRRLRKLRQQERWSENDETEALSWTPELDKPREET